MLFLQQQLLPDPGVDLFIVLIHGMPQPNPKGQVPKASTWKFLHLLLKGIRL